MSINTLSLVSSIAQACFIKLIAFTGLIALSVLLILGFRRLIVFACLMLIPFSVSIVLANIVGFELSRVNIVGLMISIALSSGLIIAQLLKSELRSGLQNAVGGLVQLARESRKLVSISTLVFVLLICPLLFVDHYSVVNGYFFPLLAINIAFVISSFIASLYFLPYFSVKLIDPEKVGGLSIHNRFTDWLLRYFYPAKLYGLSLIHI